jgi:hypothetical protein
VFQLNKLSYRTILSNFTVESKNLSTPIRSPFVQYQSNLVDLELTGNPPLWIMFQNCNPLLSDYVVRRGELCAPRGGARNTFFHREISVCSGVDAVCVSDCERVRMKMLEVRARRRIREHERFSCVCVKNGTQTHSQNLAFVLSGTSPFEGVRTRTDSWSLLITTGKAHSFICPALFLHIYFSSFKLRPFVSILIVPVAACSCRVKFWILNFHCSKGTQFCSGTRTDQIT